MIINNLRFITFPVIIISILAVSFQNTFANLEKIGRFGNIYPIVEPDLIEQIKNNVKPIDIDAMRDSHKTYQPENLVVLPKAVSNNRFYVDLTYAIDHNIVDAKGNVLYPKGFMFNPIKYANFNNGLVVIDGSDEVQIKWFESSKYYSNLRAILLVTGGYAEQLSKRLNRPVYYYTSDIKEKLHIKSVPSVSVPEADKMLVVEVLL